MVSLILFIYQCIERNNLMKYLILGAGPAGLTIANRLKELGEESFLVLEKEQEAGGLCRSTQVDGAPFDIGGGHFLDVKREKVNRFLFNYMPRDEWDIYDRNSKIAIDKSMINSPFEANIWQLNLEDQIEYLKSIAVAGCNLEKPVPIKFVDWIEWKLGKKICADYMIPYNKKMFGNELNELGTYWLDKLPNVSFEETLLSCLTHKNYGQQPGHTKFYYPKKYGYGELWLRMAKEINDNIVYKEKVYKIDFKTNTVKTTIGSRYTADKIITTIPWKEYTELDGMADELIQSIKELKYSSIETRYFADQLNTDAQWIYYPDLELPYHRILVRHNFCKNSNGYWTETRTERVEMFEKDEDVIFSHINPYAYPLNTIKKPEIMNKLLLWSKKHKVYGLGRWGEHQHYNSDVTVDRALFMAEKLYEGQL